MFTVIDYECKSPVINDSESVHYFAIFEESVTGYIMLQVSFSQVESFFLKCIKLECKSWHNLVKNLMMACNKRKCTVSRLTLCNDIPSFVLNSITCPRFLTLRQMLIRWAVWFVGLLYSQISWLAWKMI